MRFSGNNDGVAAWRTDEIIGKSIKNHLLAGQAISWQDLV